MCVIFTGNDSIFKSVFLQYLWGNCQIFTVAVCVSPSEHCVSSKIFCSTGPNEKKAERNRDGHTWPGCQGRSSPKKGRARPTEKQRQKPDSPHMSGEKTHCTNMRREMEPKLDRSNVRVAPSAALFWSLWLGQYSYPFSYLKPEVSAVPWGRREASTQCTIQAAFGGFFSFSLSHEGNCYYRWRPSKAAPKKQEKAMCEHGQSQSLIK